MGCTHRATWTHLLGPCLAGASGHLHTAPFSTSRTAVAKGPAAELESSPCREVLHLLQPPVLGHPSLSGPILCAPLAGPEGQPGLGRPVPTGPVCLSSRQGESAPAGAGCSLPRPGLDALYGEPSAPKGTPRRPRRQQLGGLSPPQGPRAKAEACLWRPAVCPRAEAWTGPASVHTTVLVSHRKTLAAGTHAREREQSRGLTCVRARSLTGREGRGAPAKLTGTSCPAGRRGWAGAPCEPESRGSPWY